jgi:Zn-dependent protease with chaperone function
MGILIAFGTALLVARKDSIPLPTRRRLYAKIVLSSVVGVIGVHALLVAATLPTRMFDPISQLWFGIRFTSVALLIVPTFVVVPFLALPFMIKQEKKLFGPSPEEVERLAAMGSTAVAAKVTPPKTVFQRFIPGVMLLLLVAGMYFLTSVDKYSPLARLKPLAPMLLLLCMLPLIITSNRRLNKVNVGQEDRAALEASLQSKIDRLCGPMGLGIVKGRLMPTFPAVRFGASADARGVAVTADAVRELADPELDFLLAHELAHIKLRHIAWRRWMILAPPACFFILFNVAIFGKSLAFVAPAFILSPFLIGLLGMVPWMIVMRRSMLKQEFEADALAIKITGAADSAIAVLKKLALNSPLPGMHEVDTTTHPAIGSRIAAIQGACN